jgi:hypothetical protein
LVIAPTSASLSVADSVRQSLEVNDIDWHQTFLIREKREPVLNELVDLIKKEAQFFIPITLTTNETTLFRLNHAIILVHDKKNNKTDIEVKNYLITTNFSTHKFTYKDSEVFKEKTLFNIKNSILTNYWDVSGLTPTEEEEAIISSLEFRP